MLSCHEGAFPVASAIIFCDKEQALVGDMARVKYQQRRLCSSQPCRHKMAAVLALACQQWQTRLGKARYRRWIKAQGE